MVMRQYPQKYPQRIIHSRRFSFFATCSIKFIGREKPDQEIPLPPTCILPFESHPREIYCLANMRPIIFVKNFLGIFLK